MEQVLGGGAASGSRGGGLHQAPGGGGLCGTGAGGKAAGACAVLKKLQEYVAA
jgi:hypothetical protein